MRLTTKTFSTVFLLFVVNYGLVGCATVSSDAVDLSLEVGKLIRESKRTHTRLARKFYQDKRERVRMFVKNRWTPKFIDNLFKQKAVKKRWKKILNEEDRTRQYEMVTDFNNRVQKKVNQKRQELLKPINRLEEITLSRLDQHYDLLIQANAQVTSDLQATRDVQQSRQKLLEQVAPEETLDRFFEASNQVVNKVTAGYKAYEDNKQNIEETIDRLSTE